MKLGQNIWDLIDNRSAQEIVNILKHKYPGVSEQRLLNDVNHTIAYLLNLEMIREVK